MLLALGPVQTSTHRRVELSCVSLTIVNRGDGYGSLLYVFVRFVDQAQNTIVFTND